MRNCEEWASFYRQNANIECSDSQEKFELVVNHIIHKITTLKMHGNNQP